MVDENEEKWYKPRTRTGWRKRHAPSTRRRSLMKTTDKRKSRHGRNLQAAKRANALANVTKDRETERKARADATHFYKRARRYK